MQYMWSKEKRNKSVTQTVSTRTFIDNLFTKIPGGIKKQLFGWISYKEFKNE